MTNITELLIKEMLTCSARWDMIGGSISPRAFLERIYQMYRKRTWNEAVQNCNSIIQMSIDQANSSMRAGAHFCQGIIRHDWQKWDGAKEAYARAGTLFWLLGNPYQPEYALTKWALAALKESTDDYDGALYDYIEAATIFRSLRRESIAQEQPDSIAHHYRDLLKKIETAIEQVLKNSHLGPPFGYTFRIVRKIPPDHETYDPIIYHREDRVFFIHNRRAQAMPASPASSWMNPSWVDFDLQLDRHAHYYAIKADSSMAKVADFINEGDYLLVCLVKDNQLPRRKDNPTALGIFQNGDGSYQLVFMRVFGGAHSDLYAYVDVILKENVTT
jgi:hypothetical protein